MVAKNQVSSSFLFVEVLLQECRQPVHSVSRESLFRLFSICPDPRNREDHRILLRPNSCLNPSVSSAAEEVPESDPNHHPFITVISVCLTSAVC